MVNAQEAATNASPLLDNDSSHVADTVRDLMKQCSDDVDAGRLNEALTAVDAALQLDSRNAAAYELRGSIYMQKELWNRAENDYSKALEIDPSAVAFKYRVAEIKYLQKAYDAARIRFAAIQSDPNLGDLATYKVFLCDLLTGREEVAEKELKQINRSEKKPSYYFCNAAWALYHQKSKEANECFRTAASLYSDSINNPYFASLKVLSSLTAPVASFVTKAGVSYTQAKVFVENNGLHASTANGWMTVPFDQLPDDLTCFPVEIRNQIIDKRQPTSAGVEGQEILSFTARNGKEYQKVKWAIDDAGLRVLTSEGWKVIAFDQLPDDLSSFPDDLREQIAARQPTVFDKTGGSRLLTFTTQKGVHYVQVKWAMDDLGLRILTSDGWSVIPFAQLPDDLSAFPPDLREQITERRKSASTLPEDMQLLTFTTSKGTVYDHVRWAMDDAGLRVLTSDGWAVVPFDQLPDDLSAFPQNLRLRLSEKRAEVHSSQK